MISLATIVIIIMGTFSLCSAETIPAKTNDCSADYVVLLHGMGRTSLSMKRLEYYLKKNGCRVINASYSSRKMSIEGLANIYLDDLLNERINDHNCKIHFVTHSLGGIIVRQYLATHKMENLGRVVMIGPPNHGSEIIDRLRENPITRNFLGASACELGTANNDLPNKLGPVEFECGVIAGDKSLNPILSSFLKGPNDGKVTVQSAKIQGMKDFIIEHGTHTWLIWRKQTLRQVLYFLNQGHFMSVS